LASDEFRDGARLLARMGLSLEGWLYFPQLAELAASLAPFVTYCIEQFGPSRCMFESNFPVDKGSYSYNVLYNAFKRLSKGYSAAERAAMFHDTAARVYRIDV
jgi:L-fuconolactonase